MLNNSEESESMEFVGLTEDRGKSYEKGLQSLMSAQTSAGGIHIAN